MKRILCISFTMLIVLFVISCNEEPEGPSIPDYTVDKAAIGIDSGLTAPNFILADRNGDTINLRNFRGKVVLFEFWATWCGSCVGFMPSMNDLWTKYKDQDFVMIGLSVDESITAWENFLNKNSYNWIQIHDPKAGWSNSQLAPYKVHSIPTTCLLNKYGQIVYFQIPSKTKIDTEISKLLEE